MPGKLRRELLNILSLNNSPIIGCTALIAALSCGGCTPPNHGRTKDLCGLAYSSIENEPFIAVGFRYNHGVYVRLRRCRMQAIELRNSGNNLGSQFNLMSSDQGDEKFTSGIISGNILRDKYEKVYIDPSDIDVASTVELDGNSWESINRADDKRFMDLVIRGK